MTRLSLFLPLLLLAADPAPASTAKPHEKVPVSLRVDAAGKALDEAAFAKLAKGDVLVKLIDNADNPVKKGVAIGVVDAPPEKVYATIGDYENFKDFMPYVVKTVVDERTPEKNTVSYWLEFPMNVGNRNYQLELVDGKKTVDGIEILASDWKYTGKGNIIGTTGSWELSPWGEGKTLARYTVFTDPGGSFPTWIKNKAAETAMPKVINAVRKRVASPEAKKPAAK